MFIFSTYQQLQKSENQSELYLEKNPLASFPRTTREGHGKDAVERNPSIKGRLRMSETSRLVQHREKKEQRVS
jgi:hypothetical protein